MNLMQPAPVSRFKSAMSQNCACPACAARHAMAAGDHDSLWRLHGVVEEEDSAIIGPVDNRVQEVDTKRFPWNTICHLCRDFPGMACAGCSGTLIAPGIVLTAAHCLWSLKFFRTAA